MAYSVFMLLAGIIVYAVIIYIVCRTLSINGNPNIKKIDPFLEDLKQHLDEAKARKDTEEVERLTKSINLYKS